ncbi:MAG: hypothetical protein R3F34_07875 [Planctomycetota bacterium]
MCELTRSVVAACVVALLHAVPARAQDDASSWSATAALLGNASDLDRDGASTPAEWGTFVSGFRPGRDGEVDATDLCARLLAPLIDTDGDGRVSVAELGDVFAGWDRDGDGSVDSEEFSTGTDAITGDAGFVQELVLRLADGGERDGVVTAEEWSAFLGAQPADPNGRLFPVALHDWIARAETLTDPDRNAFSPDVFLLTLRSELDVDKDGAIRGEDLLALRRSLDRDGDGTLSAAELAPPPVADAPSDALGTGPRGRYERTVQERRALPCLVPFQRDLDDALELVRRTGKPLLVCVNMDGENASEAFAWFRYRDPAFADLARGFVCVVASPDRRVPLDHDDRGRRIEDPRFGSVVDGEAISIEPALFERYFRGTRAAPRHVGVAPDGSILFDVYLVQDLSAVDRALAEHGVRPGERPRPAEELSLDELFDSPWAEHRSRLESLFVASSVPARIPWLGRALAVDARTLHPQLVRLGLFDPEPAVRERATLVAASRPGALPPDLLLRAFRLVDVRTDAGRELLDAVRRWSRAETDGARRALARRYVSVFAGVAARSDSVDVELLTAALALADPDSRAHGSLEEEIGALRSVEDLLRERESDPQLDALHAEASLRCGLAALAEGQNPLFHFEDAKAAAIRAGERGLAVLASSAWLTSDFAAAESAAHDALRTRGSEFVGTPLGLEVLRVAARTRTRAIYDAMTAGDDFGPSLVADVAACHRVIRRHPGAQLQDRLDEVRFLSAIEAWRDESEALHDLVRDEPYESDVHDLFRAAALRDGGSAGLRAEYAALASEFDGDPYVRWYAALADLYAAEHAVRAREFDAAREAYGASVVGFDAVARDEPSFEPSSTHYAVLALAGRARLLADAEEWSAAADAIEDAFSRESEALDAADGLGATPRTTARELADRARAAGVDPELVERLESASRSVRVGPR